MSARIAPPTEMKTTLLSCPSCSGSLRQHDGRLVCEGCGQSYPIVEGIPAFAPSNPFYDRYATEHCPYRISPSGMKGAILRVLPFWSWREWRFWRAAVPRCERLLDLGCGRGSQLFAERARETVGFDSSFQFLRDCATHYDLAVQGDLPRLPFASRVFDAVVSSHVLGHVPVEDKDTLISEVARLLRPGGLTAHIIETKSEHPIVAAARRHPETYRRQFVEQDGHVGLERADVVIDRFVRHGFRVRSLFLVDAIVPSLQNYRKYLSHPDFADFPGVGLVRQLNRITTSYGVANAVYEVGMGAFHQTAEQWFGDPKRAQFIMVTFQLEKPEMSMESYP